MLIFDNSRPVSCQNLQKVNRNNICWWCPTTHMCWCPPTTSCGGVHPPHHVVVSTHPHVVVSTHHIMWWCPTSHMCWCSPTTSCGGVQPATCAGAMNLSPWGVKQIFHHPLQSRDCETKPAKQRLQIRYQKTKFAKEHAVLGPGSVSSLCTKSLCVTNDTDDG